MFGWTADEARSFAVLDAFLDAGMNFIDTADMYSRWVAGNQGGESETIIGRWMKARGNRARVLIATKVGMEMGPGRKGLSRAYILSSVEDSLRRLQTDYIDLYQSHTDDADTPLEETLATYDELVRAGKVRVIGASNYSAERLAQALAVSTAGSYPRYESLQPLYSLCERNAFEGAVQDLCVAQNVGVIGYYSLASGFLSGKYRSEADIGKSVRGGGIKKYLDARGLAILAALDTVGAALGSTPTQVALAWLLHRPGVRSPIVSATTTAQVQELVGAATLRLDSAAMEILGRASSLA